MFYAGLSANSQKPPKKEKMERKKDKTRRVIDTFLLEGKSVKEIAKTLQVTERSVYRYQKLIFEEKVKFGEATD